MKRKFKWAVFVLNRNNIENVFTVTFGCILVGKQNNYFKIKKTTDPKLLNNTVVLQVLRSFDQKELRYKCYFTFDILTDKPSIWADIRVTSLFLYSSICIHWIYCK